MEIFAESSRLTEISLQPRQQACGVPFSVLPLKMAPSPEEEAFDFFLLFTRETNPSSLPIQRSQREGEVFPITNVIVIIPQPMRPRFPFSLLLFLPSKEELTPLSLSLLVPARFPQSRLHISGEGGRE